MNSNTFYGKKLTDMKPLELQLLGLDLNLSSLMVSGKGKDSQVMNLARGFNLRTQISNDCIKYGGNYSRQDFLNDSGFVDTVPMDEIKEAMKAFGELEKGLKGIIKHMINAQQKGDSHDTDEPNNGRREGGFEMN